MAKDYDYPIYDAGGRVEKKSEKKPNKDLKYSGKNPESYQKYLDKQNFGTAFSLARTRYDQFKWRGKVYSTKTKEEVNKK